MCAKSVESRVECRSELSVDDFCVQLGCKLLYNSLETVWLLDRCRRRNSEVFEDTVVPTDLVVVYSCGTTCGVGGAFGDRLGTVSALKDTSVVSHFLSHWCSGADSNRASGSVPERGRLHPDCISLPLSAPV